MATEGFKGLNLWRLAHLEHNPAVEAASVPNSWVKGPFLGPHFIADAAAKASPAVVNIMVQVARNTHIHCALDSVHLVSNNIMFASLM